MRLFLFLALTISLAGPEALAQIKFPATEMTPQSPVVSSFTRYGEIPMDYSTGVPQISIPVFTLKAGDIEVPISISYHASGIKVTDIASEIGLGWVFNVGGIITRTVLGQPDEISNKIDWSDSLAIANAIDEAERTGNHVSFSTEMFNELRLRQGQNCYTDRYYYKLASGESGVFRRDFNTNQFKMIPYSPTKPIFKASNEIELVSADGNHYHFTPNYHDIWYLTKIVSNNKTDSVIFYSHMEVITTMSADDYAYSKGTEPYIIEDNSYLCGYDMRIRETPNRKDLHPTPLPQRDERIVLFDSIVSSTTSVRISYANDRQDRSFASHPPKGRVNKIEIFQRASSSPIKVVSFYSSYFGATTPNKRLRLDSLRIGANGGERYAFLYNPTPLPDYPDTYGASFKFNEDYWGYYNGPNNSSTTLSRDFFADGAIKKADPLWAPACTLQRITYPTGGTTSFEFELNKINPIDGITTSDGLVGGLRIKQITSDPGNGTQPVVRRYEYSELSPSYDPEMELFNYTETRINSAFLGQACNFFQYTNSIVTLSNSIKPLIGTSRMPIMYDAVTEFLGDSINNFGKTVYNYIRNTADFDINFPGVDYEYLYMHAFQYDRGIYQPLMAFKGEYKYDSGKYKPVKYTSNSYSTFKIEKFQTGINLASTVKFYSFNDPSDDMVAFSYFMPGHSSDYLPTLVYSNTWGITDVKMPIRTEVTEFMDNGASFSTWTTFTYNDLMQVASKSTGTSDGEQNNSTFKYVNEFKDNEPYKTMFSNNNLLPVIEQLQYKQARVVRSIRTNYTRWTPTLIAPYSVDDKWGNDIPYESRVQYRKYDSRGNILSYTKPNGLSSLFLYGYRKMYPIAELISSNYITEFGYTSFEEEQDDADLKWLIQNNNHAIVTSASLTGKRCLDLSQASLYKGNLNPSTTYVVSYCYKGTEPSIGITPRSNIEYLQIRDGWTRVLFTVNNISSIQISNGDLIDEVKIYPKGTQITTYTYDPLIGLTSATDSNGMTTYFEYDGFGRLIKETDALGNVAKQYTYHEKK